jgi:hypothetical protein
MTEAEMDRPIASGEDLARRLRVLRDGGTLADEAFVARLLRLRAVERYGSDPSSPNKSVYFVSLDDGLPFSGASYSFFSGVGQPPWPGGAQGSLNAAIANPHLMPNIAFCLSFEAVVSAFGNQYREAWPAPSLPPRLQPMGSDISVIAIDYLDDPSPRFDVRFHFNRFRCALAVNITQNAAGVRQ